MTQLAANFLGRIAKTGAAFVLAGTLMLSTGAWAQEEDSRCSIQHASGNWSFTDAGTIIGLGARTAVGVFTLDAAGRLLNGVATSSLNGVIADETFSGTYTVDSNCTGTINVKIFDKTSGAEIFAVTLNVAFDSNVKELRGIFKSIVTPNGTVILSVINLGARKQ